MLLREKLRHQLFFLGNHMMQVVTVGLLKGEEVLLMKF